MFSNIISAIRTTMQYTGYSWASLGQPVSYVALLKHFHVLILHNYPRPTIVLKSFL